MPRKYRKKKYKKRRYKRKKSYPLMMGTPGGARQRMIRLRYVERVGITSTTAALNTHVFRATSLFDPNQSGVGHQPYMFDTWTSMYNKYCVVGAKITAIFSNDNVDNTDPVDVGIYLSKNTTPPFTNADEFQEAGKGTFRVMQSESTRPTICKSYYSAKKFWNITDIKDNFNKLGSTYTSSPGDNAYWQVYAQTYNGATASLNVKIIIDYFAIFSEPRDVVPS